jgi:formate-dependent phosphoribosylglycinamide formyltransferase (GAR transformylase)
MIDVEAEINKHKGCKDRDKLERLIQEYKSLARQHAMNFTAAGQYNMVAHKLQEIFDKLPAPHLRKPIGGTSGAPVKTATISNEENNRISAAWKKKAGNTRGG